jgi:hypothetical protein
MVQARDVRSHADTARDVEDRDTLERGFRRPRPDHLAVLVLDL